MIVRGENGARREVYAAFDSSTPIPRPSQWGNSLSLSGERVSFGSAVSIPAFMRGVRLISETAAGLPWTAYRGYGDDRKPRPGAPQLALLRRPNPDGSPFAVWSFTYASLLRGNAYLYKVKIGRQRRVVALYPQRPDCVTPEYDGDSVVFKLRERPYGPVVREVGPDTIIHIPGILLDDPHVGVSVVEAHRNELGNELGRQRFEGRYIANDAAPGVILKHTGPISPTPEQRSEIRQSFDARHVGNQGRTGMVWGGWDVDRVPLSLQDAQFIESKQFSVREIGVMLGIPSGFLNDPEAPAGASPEQENMRLIQNGVAPWMTRVEQGIVCDHDLFPEPDWSLELDESGFLRADIKTRYEAYRLARQGGWITANEIRTTEGKEEVEGGDQIQETPVGGAPNGPSAQPDTPDAPVEASRFAPVVFNVNGDLFYNPNQPRDKDGKWTDGVGNVMRIAKLADRARLRIPPAWTDVHVAADGHEDQPLQAIGRDAKGRVQRVYSSEHEQRQSAAKFARIGELHKAIPAIDAHLARPRDDTDAALKLIRRTGMRPGSDADTGADKDAYGATNLRVRHVTVSDDGNSVRLQFTGKKGVDLDFTFDDPELARMFQSRLAGKGEDDSVFDTNAPKVRARLAEIAPGFKVKDLRTYRGTRLARDLVLNMPVPQTASERKRARNEVGDAVARVLGNTRTVALNSYIDPAVFSAWDNADQVE